MNRKSLQGLLFAASCLGAGSACASGFQLLEQNASGLANAYAGSAAIAEDASTIFFNPAGMTQLKSMSLSVGVVDIQTSYKFSNHGSSTGVLAGNGGDGGGNAAVPNGYFAWQFNKDIYLGVGVGAPYGLQTKYDNPWMGAAQSVKFNITTINVNPSVAWKVNDQLSLGFGADWQHFDTEYTRLAGVFPAPPAPLPLSTSKVKLKANDDAWGWNAGMTYQVVPDLRIGISYRSRIDFKLSGNISVNGPSPVFNAVGSSGANASVQEPDTLIFSAVRTLDDKWQVMGDLSRTGWDSIKSINIVRTSGFANGTTAQTLNPGFRNTWRVAGGVNYKLDSITKLKFGAAYDQTPVPDAQHRLVSLPDNNRFWLTGGAQWQIGANSTLDLGVAYLYLRDPNISNNQTATGQGFVSGSYKDSAWQLGTQYSMSF